MAEELKAPESAPNPPATAVLDDTRWQAEAKRAFEARDKAKAEVAEARKSAEDAAKRAEAAETARSQDAMRYVLRAAYVSETRTGKVPSIVETWISSLVDKGTIKADGAGAAEALAALKAESPGLFAPAVPANTDTGAAKSALPDDVSLDDVFRDPAAWDRLTPEQKSVVGGRLFGRGGKAGYDPWALPRGGAGGRPAK